MKGVELVVGITAMLSAIATVSLATVFVVSQFVAMKVLPIALIAVGLSLLVSLMTLPTIPTDGNASTLTVPMVGSFFLCYGVALFSISSSACFRTKGVNALVLGFCSFALSKVMQHSGATIGSARSPVPLFQALGAVALITAVGNLAGPKIAQKLKGDTCPVEKKCS